VSKYVPLRDFLLSSCKPHVILTFKEIEDITGNKLPPSASSYRPWWANDKTHTQACNGWLAAGYIVEYVDIERKTVTFVRAKECKRLW